MSEIPCGGPARDASVVVARDKNGFVALLSADFPRHGGEPLFLPGGRREDGETPEECARRELWWPMADALDATTQGRFLLPAGPLALLLADRTG
ncbi:NUDIX hydrolase [Streptomyces lonegramiae]|uniref:NUDIX hydrolase n=1 Tax=Streptomyces lonegramiae TaxID=3075524 RepID=A0ABU2XLX2_9ACTN|nr:NUDIX hydrolase [Streptomyces sp. DSM 41529]MDT0546919.1 NUDIX hydrolase [Streptomyces sp. DSM 41529]